MAISHVHSLSAKNSTTPGLAWLHVKLTISMMSLPKADDCLRACNDRKPSPSALRERTCQANRVCNRHQGGLQEAEISLEGIPQLDLCHGREGIRLGQHHHTCLQAAVCAGRSGAYWATMKRMNMLQDMTGQMHKQLSHSAGHRAYLVGDVAFDELAVYEVGYQALQLNCMADMTHRW
jgi:hypothetical protein